MPPPVAPMSEPPAQPLPANPRPMTPPYPKTSGQALQEANMLGLFAAQQQPGMGLAEHRKHQHMTMGSKLAVSLKVLGLRQNLVGTGAQTLGHEAVGAAHRFSRLVLDTHRQGQQLEPCALGAERTTPP